MIALIPKRPFPLSVVYLCNIYLSTGQRPLARPDYRLRRPGPGGRERWDELNPALLPLGLRLTDERRRWEQSNNSGGKGAALATSALPRFRPHLHGIKPILFFYKQNTRVN